MSNRKAVETLGMPHGTAANRLRKMLLFRQLKKHNENTCIRCEKEIETVDELSVEHIKPWEGISAELFWDLDNIAFSHTRCNVPHVRKGGIGKRKIGEVGTSWCVPCQKFHSENEFSKDARAWNSLRASCRSQMVEYKKRYFENKAELV